MKPILFNTYMIRAIVNGEKTVTRRVIKNPYNIDYLQKYPYEPEDILYVRETWLQYHKNDIIDGVKYAYKADCTPLSEKLRQELGYKWRPSIHMPKDAARIFLHVTNVHVERLQDITLEQVDAEGCNEYTYNKETWERLLSSPTSFSIMWDRIIQKNQNKSKSYPYSWKDNPWVWVIEFERISKEEAYNTKILI